MVTLYEDDALERVVADKVLYENETYYLTLETHDSDLIRQEVNGTRLSNMYDWHPDNKIGKISFRNVVGTVFIFGSSYDVRSRKFLPGDGGTDQYESILRELSDLSSGIIFDNVSESTFAYEHGAKATCNIFYKFNFLKSIFLEYPNLQSPTYLFQLITHNPHVKQTQSYRNVDIQKLKKVTSQTIQRFITQPQYLQALPSGHPFSDYPLTKFLSGAIEEENLFPSKAFTQTSQQTLDTNENRFVKYFFEDAEAVSVYVKNNYKRHSHLPLIADRILDIIRKTLRNGFFKEVGSASTAALSGSSSVLSGRGGYKELYQLFLKSRLSPGSLFDFIENHLNFLDVKNIATIYEYWTFLHLCKALIPGEAVFSYLEDVVTEDGIKPAGSIEHGPYRISYNKSFTNGKCQSYALNFRPDISVEVTVKGERKVFLFDAKYRNRTLSFDNEFEDDGVITHKNEDIAKMLGYSESIKDVVASFIIYPGDRFVFYEKRYEKGNTLKDIDSMESFKGVGALPLSPGNKSSLDTFARFMAKFKKYLAE